MTKSDLFKLVGKKVIVYFKNEEKGICGILGFADEFSEKHDYRKPGYFYINNMLFKASHVRKLIESEDKEMTFDDIYEEALKELHLKYEEVSDFRPALPLYISELKKQIPGGIIIWLKSGNKVIYVYDFNKQNKNL